MRSLLSLFLALILAATPIPVNRVRVPLDDAGAATVESKPGSVSVRFERDGLAPFTCTEFGKVARWEPYVAYLRDVAAQAPSHPSADFGLALSGAAGVVGASAPGYCNAAASTHSGSRPTQLGTTSSPSKAAASASTGTV